ncbi:MAG: SAM-dependent chlorinase/fluorinase [Bacteroidota bacterium]
MPLVTLTTDFGLQDPYLAMLKGTLLCETPDLTLVDISHNVKNFDIVQAAYIFKTAFKSFPPGTIHLITVNDLAAAAQSYLVFKQFDQFFILPDNGMLGLIMEKHQGPVYNVGPASAIGTKKGLAVLVNRISRNVPLDQLGTLTEEVVQRFTLQPVLNNNQIRGTIIYIDNYDNAISNIKRNLFEQVSKKRPFEISFKRHPPITTLSENYGSVEIGMPLCRFNQADYLEIAINMGKAASLLGLRLEEMIQIDFNDS